MAEGGTIFLDEVTEMPLFLQAKILRLLQEKEYYKVGGTKLIKTNARIVCASNKNILNQVKKGLFREDLYYRLGTCKIRIPPLRERKEEILPLVGLFLNEIFDEHEHLFGVHRSAKHDEQWSYMQRLGFHQEYFEQVMSFTPGEAVNTDPAQRKAVETRADL